MCVCVCPLTLCGSVCCESFSPAGGALMELGTRRQFTATQPPTYLVAFREVLCVFSC